jgi:hypothetical protein
MSNSLCGTETFTITAAKLVDLRIVGIRYQQNGVERVLQIGRIWTQGTMHGVEWTDVPTVDESGETL